MNSSSDSVQRSSEKIIKKATILYQKDMKWFQFKMTPLEVAQIAYILRKSRNNPDALERQLIKQKIENIKKDADKEDTYFPNAIIINLTETDKIKITPLSDLLEKDFDSTQKWPSTLFSDDVILEFSVKPPPDNIKNSDINKLLTDPSGKLGYINDGQHRILGLLYSSQSSSIQLNVVASIGAESKIAFKTFADINEYQTKVTKTLLHHIRWEIEDFEDPSLKETYDLILRLDNDDDSPLKNKIKIFEDDKKRWVSSPSLMDWLNKYVTGVNGPLYDFNKEKTLRILKNYLQAWKELYSDQWNERTRQDYVLTKAMGIRIMLALFERTLRRCEKYERNRLNIDNFKNQLKVLKSIHIPLPDQQEVVLDWKGEVFGGLSSGKGINYIIHQILKQYKERETESE